MHAGLEEAGLFAERFFPRVSRDLFVGRVDVLDNAVAVGDHHGVRRLLDHAGQLAHLFLGQFAFTDVLSDGNKVFRCTLFVPYKRDGQIDPGDGAILAEVALLHRIGRDFTGQHLPDEYQVSIQVIGVGDILKSAPQQFFLRVAHNVAKLLVDTQELAIRGDMRDAHRRLAEGGAEALFAVAQRLFRLLPCLDVFVTLYLHADALAEDAQYFFVVRSEIMRLIVEQAGHRYHVAVVVERREPAVRKGVVPSQESCFREALHHPIIDLEVLALLDRGAGRNFKRAAAGIGKYLAISINGQEVQFAASHFR